MTLKFYNTPTGHVDEFVPLIPKKVTIYSCGPTVYDYPHIGNWAAYIYWDILVRVLIANNYEVSRAMNITDVGHLTSDADEGEDKLEKGARREGKTAWEIADFYTKYFMNGMNALGLVIPQHVIKATDYIPQQLELVNKLIEKGFTYQIDDGIYFDTSKFPTYANFAKLNLESQKAGARVEYNPLKRNGSDFALWKFTPEGTKRDMEWEFAGKMGFPGWAIECSAMAMSSLGDTIDIHTGGIDHIPVHHTNEIAQSESATGVRFSNYWLHNEFLKVNGTKISKSLNNVYTLEDLANNGFNPIDFRMFILQGHYRSEGNFTFEGLAAAKNRLQNWRNIAALRHQIHDTLESDIEKNNQENVVPSYAVSQAIVESINNDLSTPSAFKIIDNECTKILNSRLSAINQQSLVQFFETIDSLLGLRILDTTSDISDDAKQMIIERNTAREQKDWDRADNLRRQLLELGIEVRDTINDTIWEYSVN